MAGLSYITDNKPTDKTITFSSNGVTFLLQLGNLIDVGVEIKRLESEIAKNDQDILQCHKKLDNPEFHAKAKPEIIEEIKERLQTCKNYKELKENQLSQLRA